MKDSPINHTITHILYLVVFPRLHKLYTAIALSAAAIGHGN